MSRQKFVRSADSKSLWNCTLSPGWSQEENEILRKAIMKFGLGAWSQILKAKVLPGKTAAQLNLQTQRMLGQQSLGGFMNIKLDPARVWQDNNLKQGPEYKRKNGCVVNTGNNPTKEERQRQIAQNRERFGLSQEEIDAVIVPIKQTQPAEEMNQKQEKKAKLKRLKATLVVMETKYKQNFGELPIGGPEEITHSHSNGNKKKTVLPKTKKTKKKKPKSETTNLDGEENSYMDSDGEIIDLVEISDNDSDYEESSKRKRKKGSEDEKKSLKRKKKVEE